MKLLLILLFSLNLAYAATGSRSDIRISIEDTVDLDTVDYDANDVTFCSNYTWESDAGDDSIDRVTIAITPIAAGATFNNAIYIRNPCNGRDN